MFPSESSLRHALFAVTLVTFPLLRDSPEARRDASDPESNELSSSTADAVLVGAGDIASCISTGDEATARLLDAIPGTVFTLGDNVYMSRKGRNPFPCYHSSWGRHKARTRPVPGNHEYEGHYSDAYFDYFGGAAGERRKGYYSYDVGGWHIIALNSMIDTDRSSQQGRWLSSDLEKNRHFCTLAYFHHPRFSSGPNPRSDQAVQLWNALSDAGVDVVISGHDHIYERFAPMGADGKRDDRGGMRQFIVGTGGYSHYKIRRSARNSEVRHNGTFGVIKLTLHSRDYDWEFVPVRGGRFKDSGSSKCH
jgi:calcineurin-like phosphoesterase family protein